MGAVDFLLAFVTVLYCAFFVVPFLALGIFSLVRFFRYREQWNGEGRARQCGRDAIVFFAVAAVALGFFAYVTWNDWTSALGLYF